MNFYDVNLAKELSGGGGSQPSGSIPISENGTYDVTAFAEAVVNVSDGGGLEYESGEITLTSNANTFEIPFQKSHSVPPAIFVVIEDYRPRPNADNMMALIYTNPKRLCDIEWWTSSSAKSGYGVVDYIYKTGSTYGGANSTGLKTPDTDTADTDKTNSRYWVSETAIHVDQYSYMQWKSGNTIKWIAIWAPTS